MLSSSVQLSKWIPFKIDHTPVVTNQTTLFCTLFDQRVIKMRRCVGRIRTRDVSDRAHVALEQNRNFFCSLVWKTNSMLSFRATSIFIQTSFRLVSRQAKTQLSNVFGIHFVCVKVHTIATAELTVHIKPWQADVFLRFPRRWRLLAFTSFSASNDARLHAVLLFSKCGVWLAWEARCTHHIHEPHTDTLHVVNRIGCSDDSGTILKVITVFLYNLTGWRSDLNCVNMNVRCCRDDHKSLFNLSSAGCSSPCTTCVAFAHRIQLLNEKFKEILIGQQHKEVARLFWIMLLL